MMQALVRAVVCALLMCAALGQPALAQAPRQDPAVERPPDQQPAGAQIVLTQDASETRDEFEGLLRRLPPSVGRVFRLDASLMRNPNYLSTYPALAAFLQKHPEIINNSGYYLENVTQQLWYPPEPRSPLSDTDISSLRRWAWVIAIVLGTWLIVAPIAIYLTGDED